MNIRFKVNHQSPSLNSLNWRGQVNHFSWILSWKSIAFGLQQPNSLIPTHLQEKEWGQNTRKIEQWYIGWGAMNPLFQFLSKTFVLTHHPFILSFPHDHSKLYNFFVKLVWVELHAEVRVFTHVQCPLKILIMESVYTCLICTSHCWNALCRLIHSKRMPLSTIITTDLLEIRKSRYREARELLNNKARI